MNRTFAARAALALLGGVLWVGLAACDDDPSRPADATLQGNFAVTPDTIARQGAIRIVFNRPVNPATALDPANFVVVNTCTGLRVPGAIRLIGDTLVFSPAQALPFLTPLAVRVQNVLDLAGVGLAQPITFTRITERPPVSDVGWRFLDSPTSDQVTGVSFPTDQVGYLNTVGGTVYRTTNGGETFLFRFKDVNITDAFAIRALSTDTVYMGAADQRGQFPTFGLFRSVNGGTTFQMVQPVTEKLTTLVVRRVGTRVVGMAGGVLDASGLYHFDAQVPAAPLTRATGTPPFPFFFTGGDITPDTTKAIAAFLDASTFRGAAWRSTDGGRSYTQLDVGPSVPALFGAGVINNADALLVGDSSTVLRVTLATGAVTSLGTAQGIPRSTYDATADTGTTYTFIRAAFAPDGQTGYLVGYQTIRRGGGVPDQQIGLIFSTTNGGQNWNRQGVQGAAGNGLAFPSVFDVQVRSPAFAVLGGDQGLVAARIGTPAPAGACAFQPAPGEDR